MIVGVKHRFERRIGIFPAGFESDGQIYANTYLGFDLPVPPGNPGRYELYSINRTGEFMHPLIQGQERWVRIQLETEGTSVDLDYF